MITTPAITAKTAGVRMLRDEDKLVGMIWELL
jgi:hypothetical protein